MKLKKYLKKLILITYTSIIITACSSLKNFTHETPNDHSLNEIIYDNNHKNDNDTYNLNMQLITQKLHENNTIYFPLDRYDVLPQFFHILNMHVNFLTNNPSYNIKIEGHTDERGTPEYNIALGERRANSVKKYLQSKGVLSDQISTISYGKEKPIVIEHNEEAYAKNRRAILIYP